MGIFNTGVSGEDLSPEEENPLARKATGFEFTYAFLNLICQITIMVTMGFGVAYLFSEPLNPVAAIADIIALFSIRKGTIYRTLSSVAVSAWYIFLLIVLLKRTITVFKLFSKTVNKSEEFEKQNSIARAYSQAQSSTYCAVLMIMACRLVSGGAITVCGYIAVAVFLTNFFVTSLLTFVEENRKKFKTKEVVTEFIFSLIKNLLMIAWVCLAAAVFFQPSARDLWYGVRALFSSVGWSVQVIEALYELVVKHVLDIVMVFFYLGVADRLFLYVGYPMQTEGSYRDIKKGSRVLIILATVSAIITCVILFINTASTQFDISVFKALFFNLRSQYLPAILFAAALAF